MSTRKKHRTLQEYLRYLKGELPGEERHALERDLEADPFQKEAMEGFEKIAPGDLEEDLLSLHSALRKRLNRRRRVTLYSIAATVASLLVVGTLFINIYDFNPESDQENVPSGESVMMDRVAEPQESTPADAGDLDKETGEEAGIPEKKEAEKPQLPGEPDSRGPEAAKKTETTKGRGEAPGQEQEFEMEALQVEEEAERMAAPQLDKEGVPEIAVEKAAEMVPVPEAAEMAPVPETDAVKAVEAAPSGRQRRAVSTAKTVSDRTGQLSGVVISAEDMNPLPGASLVVKGTDSGYVADMQGRFTVPTGEMAQTTVVASYVGMVTEEYQLKPDRENRVVMQPDLARLNEVVVMEYDKRKEAAPVSAVQRDQAEDETVPAEYQGAEPAGGFEAFKSYVEKNIRFPAGDAFGEREVVVLKFTVLPDGKLSGIAELRSPGQAFTEEAIRLLKEGPAWNPARDAYGTTEEVVRMRIVFKK